MKQKLFDTIFFGIVWAGSFLVVGIMMYGLLRTLDVIRGQSMFDDIIKTLVKAVIMTFVVLGIPIVFILLILFDSFVQYIYSLMGWM